MLHHACLKIAIGSSLSKEQALFILLLVIYSFSLTAVYLPHPGCAGHSGGRGVQGGGDGWMLLTYAGSLTVYGQNHYFSSP